MLRLTGLIRREFVDLSALCQFLLQLIERIQCFARCHLVWIKAVNVRGQIRERVRLGRA